VSTAGEPRRLTRSWLRACDAFLSATLAHARYLQTSGRLMDAASADDILVLEEEQRQLRLRLDRLRAELEPAGSQLRFPEDPAIRISLATRRELRRYRDEVCEDSRRLRARSAALVRQSREVRRLILVAPREGTRPAGTMAGRPATR
jgi:hypothetical protein